jgi:hypothetical protein
MHVWRWVADPLNIRLCMRLIRLYSMHKAKLGRLGKVGVCVLALWALVTVFPDFARVFSHYNKLNIEVDNDGHIYRIADEQTERVSTHVWVDTDCTPLKDLAVVLGGMGGKQYVRQDLWEVTLCVYWKSPDLETRPALQTYRAIAAPLDIWGRITLALVQISGVAFILGGAWLVWRRPTAMTWGFYLYAVWFNPGQYYVLYAELTRWPYLLFLQEVLQAVFQAIGYCGFVIFALRFPDDTIEDRWRPTMRGLPAVGVLLAGLQLWSFLAIIGVPTEEVTVASYAAGVAVDIAIISILLIRRFEIRSPADRQRTRWVFWGCLLGLSAFIFADSNVATEFWTWMWDPSEATLYAIYLLNATIPAAVFYAIGRYRVIDVTFAISRKFTRPFLWFLIGLGVVYLHEEIEQYLHHFREEVQNSGVLLYAIGIALAFTAAVLVKLFIDRVHEMLFEIADHLFFRRLRDAAEKLGKIGAKLTKAQDSEEIDRRLIDEPVAAFDLASAALFREREGGAFFRKPAVGWSEDQLQILPGDHLLVRQLRSCKIAEPLEVKWSPQLAPGMPTGLAFPSYAIPVEADEALAAFVLYGAHTQGDDINEEERDILSKFVAAASAAYEHVEVEKLRRRVRELESSERLRGRRKE